MIDEEKIERLVERFTKRVETANLFILKEIANCIKQIGNVTPSKARQLGQLLKYGGNYNKILRKLSKLTNVNIKEINDIFEKVAKENYEFAEQFYKYRGMDFIPYEENKILQSQVKAFSRITVENFAKYMGNVSPTGISTRAIGYLSRDTNGNVLFSDLRKTYIKVIDEAVINVSRGQDVFENQMSNVMKQLGRSGLRTVDYESGYSRRLDSAVRMNLKDSLNQLTIANQKLFGEQFGANGVEISVHSHPAPDHAPIQGKQFSNEEFEKLQNHLECRDSTHTSHQVDRGIGEYNCYHYVFSIILGVSKPLHTGEQLQDIIDTNNKGITFDGEKMTIYEATQLQRRLETKIREWRDIEAMAKVSDNEKLLNQSKNKISLLIDKYHRLSKESGLKTKLERTRV